MEYSKNTVLKDGRECVLRNATAADARAVMKVFRLTHEQTDWLLTYPDESSLTEKSEEDYLQAKAASRNEIEVVAELDGVIVGTAGINCLGRQEKIRHRAEFGISVDRSCWGLGIGRALTEACIECAVRAGYAQLELTAVRDNEIALKLYESVGFREYGRNPRGFRSRISGWQELVMMRLEIG